MPETLLRKFGFLTILCSLMACSKSAEPPIQSEPSAAIPVSEIGDITASVENDNFIDVVGTCCSFAALKKDGSVTTWGNGYYGGDSRRVDADLKNIVQIFSTEFAFAALRDDGKLITWGLKAAGDSSSAQSELYDIENIYTNSWNFFVHRKDGALITWPDGQVQVFDDVQHVAVSGTGYAFTKTDGSVIVEDRHASAIEGQLNTVDWIYEGNRQASSLVAFTKDGAAVSWGAPSEIESFSQIKNELTHVKSIVNTVGAYATLKQDGTVRAWGHHKYGGNNDDVINLTEVKSLYANCCAFAALKDNGDIHVWGGTLFGESGAKNYGAAIPPQIRPQLETVTHIYGADRGFIAQREDGTLVPWGRFKLGSRLIQNLKNPQKIITSNSAIVILGEDGRLLAAGPPEYGGEMEMIVFPESKRVPDYH